MSEIVGQEHITQTLEKAITSGHISHAYLFTGPRGVGKTSIARILAHEINGIPYIDDATHMDIIEIDAASNRRIDEIRELRNKVYVAPTSAKYKVYIIDEVHMLTREAFNALLKTLEEPPAHVVFILATTDAHKLPDTIISRTQRYSFRPVDRDKVIAHLKEIAAQENIDISDDALGLLADHGEGSFRDSISLLDQASSSGEAISLSAVQNLLGIPTYEARSELFQSLVEHAPASHIAQQLTALEEQGFQATAIAKQLAQRIRTDVINDQSLLPQNESLHILSELIEVPVAHDPERFLEITLLSSASSKQPVTPKATSTVIVAKVKPPKAVAPQPAAASVAEPEQKSASATEQASAKEQIETSQASESVREERGSSAVDDSLWPQILDALKSKYNTLYGVVRMAHPTFGDDNSLQLAFAFAFHQKRVSDNKNQQIIADTIEKLSGQKLRIVCILDKELASQPMTKSAPRAEAVTPESPEALSAINNIFGGGEMI